MSQTHDEPMDAAHSMTCMEIWGGSRATDRTVTLPGLHAWVYSCPYQQADSGGDVYYVSSCATGRITRLLLADVSGHGSEVAASAEGLRLLMRRFVNHIQQIRFVASMNAEFSNLATAGRFATAVVATFLAPTRQLTFSNAGHPTPLIYTARDRKWRLLERHQEALGQSHGPDDLPLGVFEDGTYAELELTLGVGDLVLFYTDAFIESRNERGEFLSPKQFLEIVSETDADHPETLSEQICKRVRALYNGNLTDDDVTLLLFRATGEGTRIPLKNRLLAPFRLLKGLVGAALNGGKGLPLPEFSLANLGGGVFEPLTRLAKRKR